uniref:Uncharacterized protein n=1 Tax=Wuhan large pig roundworm virus TaxID=2152919 RepID=A0A2R4KPG9_9VIRU|nr:hypothetical protein [Wuhan large pig roundworm virus]
MSKRPGSPLVGNPAKVMAGESADTHTAVLETSGRAEDVTMKGQKSANKDRFPDGRPQPTEMHIIRLFTENVIGPTPCHKDVYITLKTDMLDAFSKTLRDQILNVLYPDGDYAPGGVCPEEDWVITIRSILKSRIDHVYAAHSGRRPIDRIPLIRILVPRSLAMLLNGIGLKMVLHQNFYACPAPPAAPADRGQWLITQATHARLQNFSNLVNAALQRGVIFASTISSVPEGTGWWLLRAADTRNIQRLATEDTQSVTVWAQFPDWTPADGVLAAMAATGFTGCFIDDWTDFAYKLDSLTDVVGMRASYCTQG